MLGNVSKDPKYRKRILDAVDDDKKHPIHHGVQMQAHHIISAAGVKESGLGNELERFGYDINTLDNLVLIPSTLQGACHLGVQPHRGNHTALSEVVDGDDDHPKRYHTIVSTRVSELEDLLNSKCPAEDPDQRRKVRREMDKISKKILALIENNPAAVPLTKVASHYSKNNTSGCRGVDSVKQSSDLSCPVERNHLNRQGKNQRSEKINYQQIKAYQLVVGK